jgi:hypothetical protein
MSNRTLGIILLVVGIVVALLFGLADVIGIGTDPSGFGFAQIIGLIVGILLFIVGLIMLLTGGDEEPAPAPAPTAAPPAPVAREDLTRVEGIGPALQDILYAAGITTFKALADAAPERITSIVQAADFSAPFDASSWPRQAGLAAAGDWDALQVLQDELTGGREE